MQPKRSALSTFLALAATMVSVLLASPALLAQPRNPAAQPTRPAAPTRPAQPVRPGQTPRPGRNPLPSVVPPAVAVPAVPAVPAAPPGAGVVQGVPVGTGPGQVVTPTPGVMDSLPTAAGPGSNLHEFDPGIDYQPLPPGARITFNLQDADLPDLIRAVGNITGRRFILPGKVRSIKTTIYSPTKVTPGEAYQAFLSVLDVNGMTVVPTGRYLKVIETAGAANQVLPTYGAGQDTPADDRFITRIVRLRNITPEDASNVLGHFKSRDGDITPYAATQTLIITDNAANIRRMIRILGDIDVPSVGEQVWVEPVHYAVASEISARIQEILGGGASAGAARPPGAPAPQADNRLGRIMADDRSNSMIIVATQRMYLRVLELLRRLDVSIEGEGQVHVLRLQHGDSEEMATTLNAITNGGRQAGGAGQNRGTNAVFEGAVRITAAKSNNALIITSSPRDYASLRRVIDDLDNPRRQVFIEAVVMELQINRSSKLGLNFHGALPVDVQGEQSVALGGFNALNSILLNQEALSGLAVGLRGPNLSSSQNLLPGIGISIPEFGVTLNALASSGDADVLSTPHIIATDNSPADINVGQNVPLQTNIGGGLPTTGGAAGALGGLGALGGFGTGFAAPRQDVGTKIHLVPHINDSNEVRLDIDEEISEVGAGGGGGSLGAVTINRRTAKTTVVVQDQTTVVIGGLIRNTEINDETRIPILGDIPILGALFRNTNHRTQRSNLLLFLTPYVIRDQGDLRRIFERKMRERQEFLDRYLVFGDNGYQSHTDYSRTNGIVEEVRQSMRQLRLRAQFESDSRPRPPPEHSPSESIELPPEARTGSSTSVGTPAPTAAAVLPPSAILGVPPPIVNSNLPAAVPVGIPVPP